jgi:hypothetical protein
VLLLALVLGIVTVLLSQISDSRVWLRSQGGLHVWYHLALFGLFGVLAICASRRATVRVGWLLAAALFGLAMEYGEATRYLFALEWIDVRTDALGVALGGLAGWLLTRRPGTAP